MHDPPFLRFLYLTIQRGAVLLVFVGAARTKQKITRLVPAGSFASNKDELFDEKFNPENPFDYLCGLGIIGNSHIFYFF